MTKYTSEFKKTVAKRAKKAKTYAEVGREFGIPSREVKKWLDDYEKYGDLAFVEGGPEQHSAQRMKEMEKRIADLEEENEILKKVAAVFSKPKK